MNEIGFMLLVVIFASIVYQYFGLLDILSDDVLQIYPSARSHVESDDDDEEIRGAEEVPIAVVSAFIY